jgi:hypothetical protein
MKNTHIFLLGLAFCLPHWAMAQMRESQAYPIIDYFRFTEQRPAPSAPARPAAADASANAMQTSVTPASPSAPVIGAPSLPSLRPSFSPPASAAPPVMPSAAQVSTPPAQSTTVSAPNPWRDSARQNIRENQIYSAAEFFRNRQQSKPLSAPARPAATSAPAYLNTATATAVQSTAAPEMPTAPVSIAPALPSPIPSPSYLPSPAVALPVMPTTAQAPMLPATSTAVSAPSPTPDSAIQTWTIDRKDKTLFRTLRRWSEEANYQLFWQIDRDFPIEVEIAFNTTFLDAVHNVMKGVAMTDFPLQASFNRNSRVLRISRYMSDNPQ